MALTWDFNTDKMGTIIYEGGFKRNIYNGNAFCTILNEWKEDGKDYYSLAMFFADKTHAKRCLGLDSKYRDTYGKAPIFPMEVSTQKGDFALLKVTLNKNARNSTDLAGLLLKAGITVQLVNE